METIFQTVSNYILEETLGVGTTGKVKLAERISDKRKFAIKIIRKSYFENKPSSQNKIRREISLMRFLDHPHLLKLEDVVESQNHLYIVMEYAPKGELFDYLVTRRTLSPDIALNFFRQIIYGLDYLHLHGFCHRDLKPENILLDYANQIKIGDFGFARWMKSNIAVTSCGSPHYAAPEVIKGVTYDGRSADVWSSGVILYALLCGRLPFEDNSVRNLLAKVKAGDYHVPNIHEDLKDLIAKMLIVDPNQRITISQIKEHPGFKMFLQDGYITPTPIPLPYLPEPLSISDTPNSIFETLTHLGFDSEDDVKKELTADHHNMAKVFYFMLMNTISLRNLPWKSSKENQNEDEIPVDDERFMITAQQNFAGNISSTDPFKRGPKKLPIQSLESYSSFAIRAEGWGDIGTTVDAPMEEQDIRLDMSMDKFMFLAQGVLRDLGYEMFHPDDVQLVAKRIEGEEMYVMFNGLVTSETEIDINVFRSYGDEASFGELIDLLFERITEFSNREDSK